MRRSERGDIPANLSGSGSSNIQPPVRMTHPRNDMDSRPTMHGGVVNPGGIRTYGNSSFRQSIPLPNENDRGLPTELIPYTLWVGMKKPLYATPTTAYAGRKIRDRGGSRRKCEEAA